jgi:gliding motility-associated-like protein
MLTSKKLIIFIPHFFYKTGMRKFLLLIFLSLFILQSQSQNLSYSCPRDTVLGCGVVCYNLVARFPDVRALGNDYTLQNVTNISACRPYVDPGAPGPSTNLTIDDRYSSVLPLPFTFPFYGVPYSSLIASTNGYLCFDISKTGLFSHYDDDGDLPNNLYDPALIMGPYHDLDPSETGSPTQQIKYQTLGNAPNRKWVISFYKIPLFGSSCGGLINNTHQIILHESTGIIEVQIIDKQTCTAWNDGKAMVGLQDFTKTKAIMAPNRKMSDPPWGSIGMNETWRFIPTGGLPLFRRVELLDGSGATIAVGDTVRVDANTFEWTFPNICPPANSLATYVIKTTYASLSNPATTVYSLDTVRVLRNAMPASSTSVNTTCGNSVGSITVNATGGTPPLTYSLSPGAVINTTGIFTGLPAGTYTISISDASGTCTNTLTQIVAVSGSLSGTATSTNASCPGVFNGSITVTPTTGNAPFTFSANGGPSQASGTFTNLQPGTYTIVFTDATGCTGSVTRTISPGTLITGTATSTATSCSGAADGSITVTAGSGVAPYTYSIDGGAFQTSNIFTGVSSGSHAITIQDSRGCTVSISRTVTAGTSINGSIFSTAVSCPGANDGTVTLVPNAIGGGVPPYQFRIDGGPLQATGIFTGITAGLHTVVFTDANGCSGTRSINVGAGASTSTGSSATNTSCPGSMDGTITITPVAGATYTLNPGNISNTTGIFTGLAAGSYTATFTIPPASCVGSVTPASIVIGAGPAIVGTASATGTSCPTVNDGTITVATPPGPGTTYTLNPGAVSNTTGIFTGLAPNSYTISFVTASGCTGSIAPNPVITAGPVLSSTFTQINPVCANINNGSISITPQASSAAPYSVTLTGPGGPFTLSGNAPIVFSNLAPGTYNYSFSSAGGCTGTGGPVTLTSNIPIVVPATTTMPLCFGNANGTVTFSPSGGVAPYRFSDNAGASYQTANSFTTLTAGSHIFRIQDAVGCIKDTTIVLSQPTVLTATASNNTTAGCSNNDGTIMAAAFGGTQPYAYTIAGAGVNTTGASTGIFTGLASGNYTVTITDAKGCTTTATTTVVLVDNMFLNLGPDVTICVESSVTLDPQTNAGSNIFAWTSTNALPSTIANPAVKNAKLTPTDTAQYILQATWGTCQRTDTIVVNVLHKPVPNAGKDTAICNISFATLRGSASNLSGTVNYNWSPTTGVDFPAQASTRVYPAGNDTTYTYTLTVTDNYGCKFSVTDQVNVRVQPPVPANAGKDSIAVKAVPHQLFGSGGSTYLWSPSASLNNFSTQNPLATLQNDTRFILKVTDIAGCIGYDTVFVKVYAGPTYYIPNAFSPNGDGQNDVFRAIPVGITQTDWFRIFNRYGELVFQTNQWLKGWDGTYKGKKQPIGSYVWIIKGTDRDGKAVEMKGTVMLVQ